MFDLWFSDIYNIEFMALRPSMHVMPVIRKHTWVWLSRKDWHLRGPAKDFIESMGRTCEPNGYASMAATEEGQKREWHRMANARKHAAEYPNYDCEMTWPEVHNASCCESNFACNEQLTNRCGFEGGYFVDLVQNPGCGAAAVHGLVPPLVSHGCLNVPAGRWRHEV